MQPLFINSLRFDVFDFFTLLGATCPFFFFIFFGRGLVEEFGLFIDFCNCIVYNVVCMI